MADLRFDNIPARMRNRPIDHRGFPVPWFVSNKLPDGRWDFVHVDPKRLETAYRRGLCTLSGEPLGKFVSFVVGPMCIINRVAAEPPCIPELGKWAATVCPFLSQPLAKRPAHDPQAEKQAEKNVPGLMVPDNPGGCVVWTVRKSDFERGRDRLYRFGDPVEVTFWTKGRMATPTEALGLFEARAAKLAEFASAEGPHAMREFGRMKATAAKYLPDTQGCSE
jgi:hypothetical protein